MSKTQELQQAFIAGARAFADQTQTFVGPYFASVWLDRAQELFPLKTIERPRVLDMHGEGQYRVVNGQLEYRYDAADEWGEAWFTVARVNLLAELLDFPTEIVEVDNA